MTDDTLEQVVGVMETSTLEGIVSSSDDELSFLVQRGIYQGLLGRKEEVGRIFSGTDESLGNNVKTILGKDMMSEVQDIMVNLNMVSKPKFEGKATRDGWFALKVTDSPFGMNLGAYEIVDVRYNNKKKVKNAPTQFNERGEVQAKFKIGARKAKSVIMDVRVRGWKENKNGDAGLIRVVVPIREDETKKKRPRRLVAPMVTTVPVEGHPDALLFQDEN